MGLRPYENNGVAMFKKCAMIVKMVMLMAAVSLAVFTQPVRLSGEEARIILRTGEIVDIAGEVDIKKAGEDFWRRASIGLLLSQYDMVKTREGAKVDIEFAKKDGKYFKIRLQDNSRLSFTKLESDTKTTMEDILLDLAIGDVLIKADKLYSKSKFRVRTPTSMIGIRGTSFEVIYEEPKPDEKI